MSSEMKRHYVLETYKHQIIDSAMCGNVNGVLRGINHIVRLNNTEDKAKDKRIAELEAIVQSQKVEIFKLESIVQETTIIDEDTGDVYMDGEHRVDLVAVLVASTILSGEASQDG